MDYIEYSVRKRDGRFETWWIELAEIDEALLGRKPTYGHGQIAAVFKMWVFGLIVRK